MLNLTNVEVMYDNVILVLRGISIEAKDRQITTLLGANGAGKSTTLKAISGLLRPERGEVTRGNILYQGEPIEKKNAHDIVQKGVVQVFEGRQVFEHLTAEENLVAGGHILPSKEKVAENIEKVFDYFPKIKERKNSLAGYLSGGEQQMLVIGRALMAEPKLILLDEPSLGLAPMIVEEIFSIIRRLRDEEGLTVLLVEQNAIMALDVADVGYVMENGSIVLEGTAAELKENSDIREFYLGMSTDDEKKSFKDVKHYRRRKRWLG